MKAGKRLVQRKTLQVLDEGKGIGPNLAFVSDVYDAMTPTFRANTTLAEFKADVLALHRNGEVALASADMPQAITQKTKLKRSKVVYRNNQWEFLRRPADYTAPDYGAQAKPKARKKVARFAPPTIVILTKK